MVNNQRQQPLYSLQSIHALVAQGKVDRANAGVSKNLLEMGWKTADFHAFLANLRENHFHKSYFEMSAYDGNLEVDVDAYKMCFNLDEGCEGDPSEDLVFFTKIAIVERASGDKVAVVSIHRDR